MPYFATEDGVDLYYEQHGSGEPLVLVHGFGANRQFFREQVTALADSFRVITYDLRGHGSSESTERGLRLPQYADDLRQLVIYLELGSINVLAWAMGGKILFDYIDQFGDDELDRLGLIETTPKTISDETWDGRTERYDHADNLQNLQSMVYDWEGYVEQFYMPYVFAPGFEEERQSEYEWALEEVKQNTPHVMINTWISSSAQDYRPVLPEVSVPCLLAQGGTSQLYDPAITEYMTKEMLETQVAEFPEAGHTLQLEAPEAFNETVESFFG